MRWQDVTDFFRRIARTRLSREDRAYLTGFVRQDVSWEAVVALAEMEGIAGLLDYHLKQTGADGQLPEPARRRLDSLRRVTADRTRAALSVAKSLSAPLSAARLPVVMLQGVSLFDLYPDPGLRPLGDLDVMVRPRQKEALKDLLSAQGFRSLQGAYPDLLTRNDLSIDVHSHILNLDRIETRSLIFPENLAAMWRASVPLFPGTPDLRRLDPFDNFIALAAHALKHSYARLIWLVDLNELALLLSRQSGGWRKLGEHARRWRQQKIVAYALILLEGLFGLSVPGKVKKTMGFDRLNVVERHLLRLRREGFSSTLLCNALWLQNIRGAGNRIRFIRETVYPKPPVMRQIFYRDARGPDQTGYFLKRSRQAVWQLASETARLLSFSIRLFRNR